MRPHDKDPTQFFTVVGAAYVPERRTETYQPHPLEVGFATAGTIFAAAAVLGFVLFAQTGFATIIEVAQHVVK